MPYEKIMRNSRSLFEIVKTLSRDVLVMHICKQECIIRLGYDEENYSWQLL